MGDEVVEWRFSVFQKRQRGPKLHRRIGPHASDIEILEADNLWAYLGGTRIGEVSDLDDETAALH